MSLDATLGGRSSDSYITVAQADTYFGNRLGSRWSSESTANKEKALKQATAYLDKIHYHGRRMWPNQRLQWPRYEDFIPDLRFDLQGQKAGDVDNPLRIHRYSGSADSGSTTSIVDSGLADDIENYPDDLFNDGAVRIDSEDANDDVRRSVSDFASSTGTLTVTAFPTAVAAGTSFEVIGPLHQTVIEATCELAHLMLLETGDGYPSSGKKKDPDVLMSRLVERILGKVIRRVFDTV